MNSWSPHPNFSPHLHQAQRPARFPPLRASRGVASPARAPGSPPLGRLLWGPRLSPTTGVGGRHRVVGRTERWIRELRGLKATLLVKHSVSDERSRPSVSAGSPQAELESESLIPFLGFSGGVSLLVLSQTFLNVLSSGGLILLFLGPGLPPTTRPGHQAPAGAPGALTGTPANGTEDEAPRTGQRYRRTGPPEPLPGTL